METRKNQFIWPWEAISACCCFAAGISAAVLGSLLTALTWIVGATGHPWIRGTGTALLILTIPSLILAGYCLDWFERKQENIKRSRKEWGGPH